VGRTVFLVQVIQGLIILIAVFIDAQRVRIQAPVEKAAQKATTDASAPARGAATT
jgi:hypothetical protein